MDSVVDKEVGGKVTRIIQHLIQKTENGHITWQQNNGSQALVKPCVKEDKVFNCEYNGLQISFSRKRLTVKGSNVDLIYEPSWYSYWVGNPLVANGHYAEPYTSFQKLYTIVESKAGKDSYAYTVDSIAKLLGC